MDLIPGYKQTDFGSVPQHWDVLPMGDLFTFQNGVNAEKGAYGRGIPFINVLEVITHSTLTETKIPGRVSVSNQAIRSFRVQGGDVLFNRTSETQEEVGLASVYTGRTEVLFGGFVIRARPRNRRLNPIFCSYSLRSHPVRQQMFSRGQGAVHANIGQAELSRVQVVVPPLAEQNAIAKALSDADALTESLEHLIAKKRYLKQGATHELLTGRRRLYEPASASVGRQKTDAGLIPTDWHEISAADACIKIQDGTHFSPSPGGNQYLYVTSKNIRFGYLDLSCASRIDATQHRSIYKRCDVREGRSPAH